MNLNQTSNYFFAKEYLRIIFVLIKFTMRHIFLICFRTTQAEKQNLLVNNDANNEDQ